MSHLDGFNWIAPSYDWMKHLVFGGMIRDSELRHLHTLPDSGDVLLIGGGTGRILVPLLAQRPGVRLWFIDASSAMVKRARKNLPDQYASQVVFIHGTEDAIPREMSFDVVITHYFLDLFPDERLREVCRTLDASLKAGGTWLVCDFVDTGKPWHRFLLAVMYAFFRVTAGVVARRLPAWQTSLPKSLRRIDCVTFSNDFISSCVYRKTGAEVG